MFIEEPLKFASKYDMVLTYDDRHVTQRWQERIGEKDLSFQKLLSNESLSVIYERVPVYGSVVLYIETKRLYLFFRMGTAANENHLRLSTLYYREDTRSVFVDPSDFCYWLDANNNLRYGRNKRIFVTKTK